VAGGRLLTHSKGGIGKGSQAGPIRDVSSLSFKSRTTSSAINVMAPIRILTSAFANSNFLMCHTAPASQFLIRDELGTCGSRVLFRVN
jgi:hypothetical protein